MECFNTDGETSINSNKLLSDNTLIEKKERLKKESREQCCFCMLFSTATIGTTVVASASHGATLPATIPGIIVSVSSASMCFKQYINKMSDVKEIDHELEKRKENKVRYVDNFSNLSIYNNTEDTLHKIHHPVL